jgi:regulator of ribonuclease activity A
MPKIQTAELWDRYGDLLTCADPIFLTFGRKRMFWGEVTTLKLFEDNSLVRKHLGTNGMGKILVNGCIRDSYQINQMEVGIMAIATCPVKSIKQNSGELDVPVKFAGLKFTPGHFLYADDDGLLVSDQKLIS